MEEGEAEPTTLRTFRVGDVVHRDESLYGAATEQMVVAGFVGKEKIVCIRRLGDSNCRVTMVVLERSELVRVPDDDCTRDVDGIDPFEKELTNLLNRYGWDTRLDRPDFEIGEKVMAFLLGWEVLRERRTRREVLARALGASST